MNERPPQPPEGKLIADALEASGLSIREASRRAGISYGRWRQITSGVQNVSPGSYAAVRAPAKTLAKMAAVVGVTAKQMEDDGRRPDAAEILRADPQPPRLAPVPPVAAPHASDDDSESAAEQELVRLLAEHPGDKILALISVRGGASAQTRLREARGWLGVQADIQRNGTTD